MSVSSPLRADLRFLTDVAEELDRARKDYADVKSIDDGRVVMLGVLEMLTACAHHGTTQKDLLRQDLVRIAAMATRTAVDVLDD